MFPVPSRDRARTTIPGVRAASVAGAVLAPLGLVCALAVVLAGCATTGPRGQQSFIIISTAQEIEIGQGVDQSVRQQYKMAADPRLTAYVKQVGERVAARSERQDIAYSFALLESDEVNAFAAPAGFIYVTTGLLREAKNEAELAGVMAHEIGHVVGRHTVRGLQAAYGAALATDLVLGDRETSKKIVELATGVLFLKNSRENELEADEFGLKYAYGAGYDPRGIVTFFRTLLKAQGGPSPGGVMAWLNTHPATEERIGRADGLLAAYDLSRPLETDADRYLAATASLRK